MALLDTVEFHILRTNKEKQLYFNDIESVIELCMSDFVPYEGYGTDSGGVSPEFFDNYTSSEEEIVLALLNGTVIGFLCFEPSSTRTDVPVQEDKFGYLSLIMVHPEYRGQYIGVFLLYYGICELRYTYDHENIYLSTWSTNESQIRIMTDVFGFKEVNRKSKHRVDGSDSIYFGLID